MNPKNARDLKRDQEGAPSRSKARSSGGNAFDGPDGPFKKKKKNPSKLIMTLVLGALLFGGLGKLLMPSTQVDPGAKVTSARVMEKSQKKLAFSAADENKELTEEFKEALTKGEVPPALEKADPVVHQKIKSGEMKIFNVTVLDTMAEDGDIVEVSVDGMKVGMVLLNNGGTTLHIPLSLKNSRQIKITAYKDGGGGVTFGARTNLGQQITKVMKVGDFEYWEIGQ